MSNRKFTFLNKRRLYKENSSYAKKLINNNSINSLTIVNIICFKFYITLLLLKFGNHVFICKLNITYKENEKNK